MSVLHVLAMFSICTPSFIWHYKAATCTIMINYCTSLLHTWFCGLVCNCILKQVRPSHRPAHTWFLKILSAWASVCEWMCLHVCVPPPRLIKTSGMTWCYVDHIWLNYYMVILISIINGRGLDINTCYGN